MADHRPDGIRDAAQRCLYSFERCQLRRSDEAQLSKSDVDFRRLGKKSEESSAQHQWAENRLAEFRLWIDNSGARAGSKACLDARLEFAPQVKDFVIRQLKLLDLLLDDYCQTNGTDTDATKSATQAIDDVLDQLTRYVLAIRKTGHSSRIRKADSHFREDDYHDFAAFLKALVLLRPKLLEDARQAFSSTTSEPLPLQLDHIQSRLVRANLRRRHRFVTAQNHIMQSERKVSEILKSASDQSGPTSSEPMAVSRVENAAAKSTPLVGVAAKTDRTATTFVSTNFQPPVQSSTPSQRARTMISTTGSKIVYPLPPKSTQDQRPFHCPCCCQMLPSMFADTSRWRQHLVQDVCPYVCVLDSCPCPEAMYVSKKLWLEHIQHEHQQSVLWQCLLCQARPFFEHQSFTKHASVEHSESIEDLVTYAEICKVETFPDITSCPLCSWAEDQDHTFESSDLLDHIAEHLHSFALYSLPWRTEMHKVSSAISLNVDDWLAKCEEFDLIPIDDLIGPASAISEKFSNDLDVLREVRSIVGLSEKPLLQNTGQGHGWPEFLDYFEEKDAASSGASASSGSAELDSNSEGTVEVPSMRLLKWEGEDVVKIDEYQSDLTPNYAILSHTWGETDDEVTLEDVINGTGRKKPGFAKIRFCAKQARKDGLEYFWIDTCCIDKTNYVEVSSAINSMYDWYQKSTKCYVILADFQANTSNHGQSRWFTRGWTLQELLAPRTIEFFSSEGHMLGNQKSMEQLISRITKIPVEALGGAPLDSFGIEERMSWQAHRETTIEEDKAYSLLGMFNVSMPILYGEGSKSAYDRLRLAISTSKHGASSDEFVIPYNPDAFPKSQSRIAQEELTQIHAALQNQSGRQFVVLCGDDGGISTTQLALAYAERYHDRYTSIFWVQANDLDSVRGSFAEAAKQIQQAHPATLDDEYRERDKLKDSKFTIINSVMAWLDRPNNTKWLLIFDACDDLQTSMRIGECNAEHIGFPRTGPLTSVRLGERDVELIGIPPEADHGSVIVTSRQSRPHLGIELQVEKIRRVSSGLKTLANIARRPNVIDDPATALLVDRLGGLPLALEMAGAYLRGGKAVTEYLRLYESAWSKLEETKSESLTPEDRILQSLLQLTSEEIERRSFASAQLLRLWKYYDKVDLWYELVKESSSTDFKWLDEITKDEASFCATMQILSDYGLIATEQSTQALTESEGYSLIPAAYTHIVPTSEQESIDEFAMLALTSIARHAPNTIESKWWLKQKRLVHHARTCCDFLFRTGLVFRSPAWALESLGNLFLQQGMLDDAEPIFKLVVDPSADVENPSALHVLNNLGTVYADLNRPKEAEKLYKRVLARREELFGLEHLSTLITVNNLGLFYAIQDELAQAEFLCLRASRGLEKLLGAKHPSALEATANLALVYTKQDKFKDAERLYQLVLEGRESVLGREHPITLETVNDYGNLYAYEGHSTGNLFKLATARQLHQRASAGLEGVPGMECTFYNTVTDMGKLCVYEYDLYHDPGKLAEAVQLYSRAVLGFSNLARQSHPSYLIAMRNFATVLVCQGELRRDIARLETAASIFQSVITCTPKVNGSSYPEIAAVTNDIQNVKQLISSYREDDVSRARSSSKEDQLQTLNDAQDISVTN